MPRQDPFRWVVLGLIVLAVVLFTVFVYPTRYRYERFGQTVTRIDRITGCADYLELNGWQPMRSAERSESDSTQSANRGLNGDIDYKAFFRSRANPQETQAAPGQGGIDDKAFFRSLANPQDEQKPLSRCTSR